jgi:CRISPR-associated endonuclease Csn1
VRVDVFRETDKKGRARFHLVPIYVHQVADRKGWPKPPDRAVVAHKDEAEWTVMGVAFEFLFSLFKNSFISITKKDGEVVSGYFRGLDSWGAQISIADQAGRGEPRSGIGSKTLLVFQKFSISRLGEKAEILREVRTWHGVACT